MLILDFLKNKTFAGEILRLLDETGNREFPKALLPGNRPYIYGEEGGGGGTRHRPTTKDSCIMCGLCAGECPQGAIARDNKTVDHALCISCFRCVRHCPVQAKECVTEAYIEFARDFTEKLAKRRENEYFI